MLSQPRPPSPGLHVAAYDCTAFLHPGGERLAAAWAQRVTRSALVPTRGLASYSWGMAARRVYFAGEHASLSHTWMQGAFESALRALAEILVT